MRLIDLQERSYEFSCQKDKFRRKSSDLELGKYVVQMWLSKQRYSGSRLRIDHLESVCGVSSSKTCHYSYNINYQFDWFIFSYSNNLVFLNREIVRNPPSFWSLYARS